MEHIDTSNYAPPVDTLLTYGEAKGGTSDQWPNYLELGLEPGHIPDLIRMATDANLNWADSESLEVWAPIHAWRALGQLRAEAAVEPLLSLFEDLENSDWVLEELPEVFGMIGSTALSALAAYISDVSFDEDARISAIPSVEKIGLRWPEARSASIALLTRQLERFAENTPEINGFLVLGLVELKAAEALPLIERAFAARRIDLTIMGDWGDVQIEFGLKSREEVEQERSQGLPETPFPSPRDLVMVPALSSKKRYQGEAIRKKMKSKMAHQSRKKNRKR